MLRKLITGVIIAVVVIVGSWSWWMKSRDVSSPVQHQGVVANNWSSAWGAVDGDMTSLDKQKLSFWVTVWNDSTQQSYVKDVKMKLPDSLLAHVLSGDTVITVNKFLNANASYQVNGALILDTKGMTKQEIVNLGEIQGFTVETGINQ